jgi:hypothetical protein
MYADMLDRFTKAAMEADDYEELGAAVEGLCEDVDNLKATLSVWAGEVYDFVHNPPMYPKHENWPGEILPDFHAMSEEERHLWHFRWHRRIITDLMPSKYTLAEAMERDDFIPDDC